MVSKEDLARAKEMDLLTYLQNYEPQKLVKVSGDTYCNAIFPKEAQRIF